MLTSMKSLCLVAFLGLPLAASWRRPGLPLSSRTLPRPFQARLYVKKDGEEEQSVQDLNLEQMFEVFEAADKSDADEGKKDESKASPSEDDAGNDIVKRVMPRDDWWSEGPLASPLSGVAKEVEDDPLDNIIVNSPIPSGAFLGLSVVLAISFVGCIFQLFYDKPAAPVLGVPATGAILVLSGPLFFLSFLAAIKKGNAETDADYDD